jgi:hypothetical protein
MSGNSSRHSTTQLVSCFQGLLQDYHNLDPGKIEDFLKKHSGNKELMARIKLLQNYYKARQELYPC